MNIRKTAATLTTALLLAAFAACGGQVSDAAEQTEESMAEPTTEPYLIPDTWTEAHVTNDCFAVQAVFFLPDNHGPWVESNPLEGFDPSSKEAVRLFTAETEEAEPSAVVRISLDSMELSAAEEAAASPGTPWAPRKSILFGENMWQREDFAGGETAWYLYTGDYAGASAVVKVQISCPGHTKDLSALEEAVLTTFSVQACYEGQPVLEDSVYSDNLTLKFPEKFDYMGTSVPVSRVFSGTETRICTSWTDPESGITWSAILHCQLPDGTTEKYRVDRNGDYTRDKDSHVPWAALYGKNRAARLDTEDGWIIYITLFENDYRFSLTAEGDLPDNYASKREFRKAADDFFAAIISTAEPGLR